MRWRPGLRPGPAGGPRDAPPDTLIGWGVGHPLHKNSTPRRLDPRAFSVRCIKNLCVTDHLCHGHHLMSMPSQLDVAADRTPQSIHLLTAVQCSLRSIRRRTDEPRVADTVFPSSSSHRQHPRPLRRGRRPCWRSIQRLSVLHVLFLQS